MSDLVLFVIIATRNVLSNKTFVISFTAPGGLSHSDCANSVRGLASLSGSILAIDPKAQVPESKPASAKFVIYIQNAKQSISVPEHLSASRTAP